MSERQEQLWKAEDALDRAIRREDDRRAGGAWKKGEKPEVLAKLKPGTWMKKRSAAPVRRRSVRVGREGVFWRSTRRADVRTVLLAAERYDLAGRLAAKRDKSGERSGPLGAIGLAVLKELAGFVNYKSGRLDPCYETLAQQTGFARSAIIAACKRLREHGFLDWIRRFEDDPQPGQRGPQVKQASNAYRFMVPGFVARWMGFRGQAVPLPEDDEDRRNDARKQHQRWEFEDSPLFQALHGLGDAIAKAERLNRNPLLDWSST